MKSIEKLVSDHKATRLALDNELLRNWPKGSEVRFKIRDGQKTFSTGTIYGLTRNSGYMQIKHHQAKPNSRFSYRDVHYTQILPLED
jgi:hypothetical protein